MQNSGKPIEANDAKGAKTLSAFDTLQRPTHVWAQNNSSDSLRLTIYSLYGEAAANPTTFNLLGKPWQVYDESGKTESVAFDFKGNLLSKKQQVISSAVLKAALDNYQTYLVDWTGLPTILDTKVFETSSAFDALNRATKITLPENVNSERKEIVPTYNRAGALEQVHYDGTLYVENIAYNAKGQRLLIAFGNDIMTRYVYQPTTFRLLRQRSERFTKTQAGNTITYTAVSGTNKQDDGFNFDLVGNILKILTRVTDCGITGSSLGSDALDKVFTYNSVYRLTSATGRESNTQHENDYLYADAPVPGSPNANHVQAYKREYGYDKLGNVLKVQQTGNNAFTRNFSYHTGKNTLEKVETGSASLIENFTYDACGNQLTAGASRNYVWNAANQLITYYNQAGSADPTIFAQYDYAGQERVSKIVRTGTGANPVYERTIYIDGIFEYHILENGTTYEKNYVHIMDDRSRIAMVRIGDQFPDDINEAITYNLENQIGSSTVRLTETGTIIDKEEYYPFGDSSLRTFSKKRYRYVGREKDLESGLYYYGARYYCAWTCRFISVDPLASDYMYLTPYNYADNNPINDYDIDGMQDTQTQTDSTQTTPSDSTAAASGKQVESETNLDNNNISSTQAEDSIFQNKLDEMTSALKDGESIESYSGKGEDGVFRGVIITGNKQITYDSVSGDFTESEIKFRPNKVNAEPKRKGIPLESSWQESRTFKAPDSIPPSASPPENTLAPVNSRNIPFPSELQTTKDVAGAVNIVGELAAHRAEIATKEVSRYGKRIPATNRPNRIVSAKVLTRSNTRLFTKVGRGLGKANIVTGTLGAGLSFYKMYSDYQNTGKFNYWDLGDGVAGAIGAIVGVIALFIASPILVGIGIAVMAYFITRLFIGD